MELGFFFSEPPFLIEPISVNPSITTDGVTIFGAYASQDANGLQHFTFGVPVPERGVLFWPVTYLPVFPGGRSLANRSIVYQSVGLSNYITAFEKTDVDEVTVHFVGSIAQFPGASGWTATDSVGTQVLPAVVLIDPQTVRLTFGTAFNGGVFVRCIQPFSFVFADLRPLIGPIVSLMLM